MGRIAAYLGPQMSPATLLEGGSYALVRQATEFADGFGLGWFPLDGHVEPVRVVSRMPLWSAGHTLGAARRYPAECAVAEIRRADAHPAELAGQQPHAASRFLFAHDGELERFDEVFRRPLTEGLSNATYAAGAGGSASQLLFAAWLDALNGRTDADAMASALETLVGRVTQLATHAGAAASFAIVVTDGASLLTLRTATRGTPPPLYTIVAEEGSVVPVSGRVVASEPLFPGAWTSLDAHSLVIFTVAPPDEAQPTQPAM